MPDAAVQMYDNLNWPGAVQELIQASEYLISTGSPKVPLAPHPTPPLSMSHPEWCHLC